MASSAPQPVPPVGTDTSASIRSIVRKALSEVRMSISLLLSSLSLSTRSNPPVSSHQDLLSNTQDLLLNYTRLRRAVLKLKQHQAFQSKIVALKSAIRQKDDEIIAFAASISDLITKLEAEIYEVSKPLLGEQTQNRALGKAMSTRDILELSRKLSYSTSAPSGWHFSHNREIPVPFRPPAPQEENMKKGLLFTDTKVLLNGLKQSRELKGEKKEENVEKEEKEETEEKEEKEDGAKVEVEVEETKKRPRGDSKGSASGAPSVKKVKKQASTFDLDVSSSEGED